MKEELAMAAKKAKAALKRYQNASRAYQRDCNWRWNVEPDEKRMALYRRDREAFNELMELLSKVTGSKKR